MVMQDYIEINGIDVTDYRLNWNSFFEWGTSIDSLNINLSISLSEAITLIAGMIIIVKRGTVTATDEFVFEGQITQIKPSTNTISLVCKGALYESVKAAQTKSWDKDIDTEGGVGSEIFKAICDNSQLTYTPALGVLTDGSIVNTGASDSLLIRKFVQNDEDDFQKMNQLAEYYNFIISYDYDNSLVNFQPKGYTIYPIDLNVGTEIQEQIKWKTNMEQLINKVKIQGATVYNKIIETFAGPASEFTLSKTPEDSELRINYSTTNDLQIRGQKSVGTLGTDFDYYIDVEQKKVVFSSDVSDVWINYGSQVPMPVVLKNISSIETYGGPNKTPHFKKIIYNDIKDVADAEARGRAILNKYSIPFTSACDIPISNAVIEENRNFLPGDVVRIIDTYNDKDIVVFVQSVTKSWPHIADKITVGDEIWRTEDWQAKQMEKIEQLISELNKNQDILIQTVDINKSATFERRYGYLEKNELSGVGGIYNSTNIEWGTYNRAVYGGPTRTTSIKSLQQGNNTYKELIYDEDFYDSVNSDVEVDWDTTAKKITIPSEKVLYSDMIALGTAYKYYTLELSAITGTYLIEISADGKSNWQTMVEDTRTNITNYDTTGVYFRITNTDTGAGWPTPWGTWGALPVDVEIINTYKNTGDYDSPAIKIKLEE